ncbi:MAG TPA: ABC transporter substrate-binding protein [Paenibacillus sp.]|nr:ABC transporter substrate-binding protein [Paenibacillus sp.]
MKKATATLMLASIMGLTLALSACGGGTGSESADGEAGGNGAETDGGTKSDGGTSGEGDAPKEKVTIDFWANQFEETTSAWFKKWVEEFNKTHDDIKVNLTIVPGDAWDQKMKAAQAAGKAPQVYTRDYGKIVPAATQGQFMALDDYVDPAIWADLYPNIEEFVMYKGKHYAYPKLVEPSAVLYYRKDLFQAAGLDPEKPPATWDELIEYGKKLSTNGVYGLHIASNAVEFSWTTWGLQMNGGHRAISDDWSKATLDDHYKNIISFYKRIYDEKVAPAQALNGYTDMADFGQGKVAMSVNGSWGIGQLRNDYKDLLPNVGVAPMPTPDGDSTKPSASLGGWTFVMDGKAKNPKEAATFISWMLAGDPAIMIDYFRTSQFSKFPARKSVDDALNADPQAQNDEVRKMIAEKIVPYSVSEPTYPWDVSFAFGSAIERAIQGQDPEEALAQAEKEINEFIQKQNLPSLKP